MLGYTAYAGYAQRARPDLSWDVGVTNTNATDYDSPKYTVNYTELYAGLASEHLSARLYYSPNYLGEARQSIYADLSGSLRPAPRWRLFGHVGVLTPLNGTNWGGARHQLYDLRVGAAFQIKACELRAAYTASAPKNYTEPFHRERGKLAVGASLYF